MSRRVLVCGGRSFENRALVFRVLDAGHAREPIGCIVHGACCLIPWGRGSAVPAGLPTVADLRGADRWADEWARERGIERDWHPADWSKGPSGGPHRNAAMIETGIDIVVAFVGGKGTRGMVALAEKAGVPVRRVGWR